MRAPYQTQRGKGMVIGRDRRVSPYIVQNETQSRQAWASRRAWRWSRATSAHPDTLAIGASTVLKFANGCML